MGADKYDESFITDIKARVPLPALVGASLSLAKDGGELKGLCPFHSEKTPSFTVYEDHYHCYGCNVSGDHLDWLQNAEGLSFKDAVEKLAAFSGSASPAVGPPKKPKPVIGRPPENTAPPECLYNGARPTLLTPYRDESGHPLFYVARHDTDAGKVVRPWSWDKSKSAWVSAGYPYPRPVLGLHRFAADKSKAVLLVEGEKKRDAVQTLVGAAYEVASWCGGSQAISKTDWSPLFGRRVLMWPDADRKVVKTPTQETQYGVSMGAVIPYDMQPGPAAMRQIASILGPHGGEIKILDVGIDDARADGWDGADAVAEGWNWRAFVEWARPRAKLWKGAEVVNLGAERQQRQKPEAPRLPVTLQAKWDEVGLQLNDSGKPFANLDNALRVLERWPEFKDAFWHDEFFDRFYTTWGGEPKEWEDSDSVRLTAYMQREMGIRNIKKVDVKDAVVAMGKQRTVHAARDWMESLTWDGIDRIEYFFGDALGAAGTEYVRSASRNFWIGLAARILEPGCKVDNMVVLEGEQGARKSSAIALVGGEWFAESGTSVTDKDFFQQLPGKMIVEIAELDAFSKADQRRIKSVLSRRVDRYRPSYGHFARDYPRQVVFVGSTNEKDYLEDPTGGRRYWPIRCGEIDLDLIKSQRDQLFAESVARFRRGETWWEMPGVETGREQEARREKDAWEELVARYLRGSLTPSVSLADVANEALNVGTERLDKITQRRIAQAMRLAGWMSQPNGRWERGA